MLLPKGYSFYDALDSSLFCIFNVMANFNHRLLSGVKPKGGPLSFQEHYPCPVCRYGQIEGLFMVDAFSCSFCRHIFTVQNEPQECLLLEDHAQPLKWLWSGDRWSVLRQVISREWLIFAWILGILFVVFPTGIVWLFQQIFPPLPEQSGAMLPLLGLTFAGHFAIAGWICLEYYQWPFYMTLKFYSRWILDQILVDA